MAGVKLLLSKSFVLLDCSFPGLWLASVGFGEFLFICLFLLAPVGIPGLLPSPAPSLQYTRQYKNLGDSTLWWNREKYTYFIFLGKTYFGLNSISLKTNEVEAELFICLLAI